MRHRSKKWRAARRRVGRIQRAGYSERGGRYNKKYPDSIERKIERYDMDRLA